MYRFEESPEGFRSLLSFLDSCAYELVIVDAIEEFVVAVEKYTAHLENISKELAILRNVDVFNCFLLTDWTAVDRATLKPILAGLNCYCLIIS